MQLDWVQCASFARSAFRVSVLFLFVFGSFDMSSAVMAQDAPKMFLGQERISLLEVIKVDATRDDRQKDSVKHFVVSVKEVAHLPPGRRPDNYQIAITQTDPNAIIIWRKPAGTQDWFPLGVGKRVVVAFNGKDIPPGNVLLPLEESSGYTADAIWHDCMTFYEAVRQPKADQAAELTKRLREQKHRLGPTYFHLIDRYDQRRIVGDEQFSLAAADYLSNPGVPLKARIEIIRDLRNALAYEDTSNRALVASIVRLVREAKQAGLHPGEVGNLLMSLSLQFVTNKRTAALPDVEPSVRRELIELARDQKVVADFRQVVPLVNWLEGKEPGGVPRSLNGSPPPDDRKPVQPKPPKKTDEDAPKSGVVPREAPPADQDSFPWMIVVKAACVVVSTSAFLLLLVHWWRRRRDQ